MIFIQNLKLRYPHGEEELVKKAASCLGVARQEIKELKILRRSLDCRKKPELYYLYSVEALVSQEKRVLERALRRKTKEQISLSERKDYVFPAPLPAQEKAPADRPVVIGAGPAGLFCTYYLALAGLHPILLERGKTVEERQKDVETFWQTGRLLPNSNVQFGEGGAGTFSDGKLNTLVKDREGRNRAVLETFVKFGAKESILYDAKPHIGTDVLAKVMINLRQELIRLGADLRFETRVTDLLLSEPDRENETPRLRGLLLENGEEILCQRAVLAIGHSARDTFFMLRDRKLHMEAKAFAVGFRVEHPQEMINRNQYGLSEPGELGAANYKVTAKTSSGRGVYSFCMCPGGYVVNASSEEGRLAVNGMSYSGRNGKNSNSAIIVSVGPEDYPDSGPLGGVLFQRELEEKAYRLGAGKIPVQRYGDYKSKVTGVENDGSTKEKEDLTPESKGAHIWADLSGLLPEECNLSFVEGMTQFGRQIPGFDREDAILSGVESRTSSPVRIVRDDSFQSNIRGIYPCGEGAGYAGGITSAAMDGLRVGEEIYKDYLKS